MKMKKLLSIVLIIAMVISLNTGYVFAEESIPVETTTEIESETPPEPTPTTELTAAVNTEAQSSIIEGTSGSAWYKLDFDTGRLEIGGSGSFNLPEIIRSTYNEIITNIYIGEDIQNSGVIGYVNLFTNLCSVEVADGNQYYTSLNGILFNKTMTDLYLYPASKEGENYEVPATVTQIYSGAFSSSKNLKRISFQEESQLAVISSCAFAESSLESIEIPSTVSRIGVNAFTGCRSISSITIPDSVQTLDVFAFSDCENLTEVIFEENSQLTSISRGVFSGCKNISSITVPASVQTLGESVFDGCENLQEVYFGEESNLQIIGPYAFSKCINLREIQIPSSVGEIGYCAFVCSGLENISFKAAPRLVSIGGSAFMDCINLSSITIPAGVQTIGNKIFFGCESLSEVTFAEDSQLSTIGAWAFSGCNNLLSIDFPASVQTIESNMFNGCNNLQSVHFNNNSQLSKIPDGFFNNCSKLSTVDFGANSQLTSIGKNAFRNCTNIVSVIIPAGVSEIGDWAFYGCNKLQQVTIEEGSVLTQIGRAAFSNCNALSEINLPNGLSTIGEEAFFSCKSLTAVNLPVSVTNIGSYAFKDCINLQNVTADANGLLTGIPQYAFSGCTNLQTIILPKDIKCIDDHAFYNCKNLTSINIPAGVSEIGDWAFYGCKGLQNVTIENGSVLTRIGNGTFRGCSALTQINLPFGLKTIGGDCFIDCRSLTTINIPSTVSNMGGYVFKNCRNLQTVTFGPASAMEEISQYTFWGCRNLQNILIPEGIKVIGKGAFKECYSLRSAVLPSTIEIIGKDAFRDCYNLNTLTFNGTFGLREIGNYAFYNCSIRNLMLPGSLVSIGNEAFVRNGSIREINIPSSVSYLGKGAFESCWNLQTVTFGDNSAITEIPDRAFRNTSVTGIQWPSGIVRIGNEAFRNAAFTELNIPDSVTSLGKRAFSGNVELTGVTFNEGSAIDELPTGVFEYCAKLSSVEIPQTMPLTRVSNRAFEGTKALTSITLPDTVNYIGPRAFYGSGITNFTVPSAIGNNGESWYGGIRPEAFRESDIETISIPGSVRRVGYSAFRGCTNLKNIDLRPIEPVNGYTQESGFQYVGHDAFNGCVNLTTTGLKPNGHYYIDNYAYYKCRKITGEINLPIHYTGEGSWKDRCYYGGWAFSGTGITKVDMSPVYYGVTPPQSGDAGWYKGIMGYGLFENCKNLKEVILPEELGSLGPWAFAGCSSLESVKLPSYLESIGSYAFNGSGLKSVELPEAITNIDDWAFQNTKLETVDLPNTVRRIGYGAFDGCSNLTEIDLSNVKEIDDWAFNGTNLKSVTIGEAQFKPTEQIYSYLGRHSLDIPDLRVTFTGTLPVINDPFNDTVKIRVKCDECNATTDLNKYDVFKEHSFVGTACSKCGVEIGTTEAYAGSSNLIKFPVDTEKEQYIIFDKEEGAVTGISYFDNPISELIIPSQIDGADVLSIGSGAFADDEILSKVILPEGLLSIENEAFANCSSLTEVSLPMSLESMSKSAFDGDEKLILTVYKDSYGQTAALKQGLKYKIGEGGNAVQPPEEVKIGLIELGKAYSKAGNEIVVPVKMLSNPGIANIKLSLDYDRDAMQLTGIENGDIFTDNKMTADLSNLANLKSILWSDNTSTENNTNTGTLVKLKFKVKDGAATGTYAINAVCSSAGGAYDFNGVQVLFDGGEGQVEINDFLYGDMSNDGEIDINDAAFMKYCIADYAGFESVNRDAGDVDLSGYLNARDLMILERYLAKWTGYDCLPDTRVSLN